MFRSQLEVEGEKVGLEQISISTSWPFPDFSIHIHIIYILKGDINEDNRGKNPQLNQKRKKKLKTQWYFLLPDGNKPRNILGAIADI